MEKTERGGRGRMDEKKHTERVEEERIETVS